MGIKSILGATCACLVAVSFNVNASLIGTDVNTSFYSSEGTYSSAQYTVVGPGEEGDIWGSQFYDYDAFSFSIRSTINSGALMSGAPDATVRLRLWIPEIGASLTGVTVNTTLSGVVVDMDNNHNVYFTWDEQAIGIGTYLSASFETTTSPVPIPATVWLFGSGLIGLIGVARRKKV